MVEQSVIDDMADYMVKLEKALTKRNFSLGFTIGILGQFAFNQFNGTRNDTKMAFDRLIEVFNKKR